MTCVGSVISYVTLLQLSLLLTIEASCVGGHTTLYWRRSD